MGQIARIRKIISIALILFVIYGGWKGRGIKSPNLLELKLINGERKINGAENTTSPALILPRQSGNEGFPGARAERNRFSSVSHRPYVAQIVMRLWNANGKAMWDRVDECPHYTNTASYSSEINRLHYSLSGVTLFPLPLPSSFLYRAHRAPSCTSVPRPPPGYLLN